MLNRKAMVLYCGSASGMAPSSPASPCGGGVGRANAPLPEAVSPHFPAGLMGRGSWAPHSPSEGTRALIGGGPRAGPLLLPPPPPPPIGPLEGAPRPLICSGAGQPLGGAAALLSPEEELDGCEPDMAEPEADGMPSLGSDAASEESAEEVEAGPGGEHEHDPLRKETLALVARYLREAAAAAAAEGGSKGAERGGGGSGGGKILRGLWDCLGTGHGRPDEAAAAASASVEQALETLRRVGDGILDKHRLAFQGMLKKMEIKEKEDLKTVSEVATHVFSDGITNWGRIVTLISFGAFVAKHLKSINQESCISTLAEIITDVLVTDKREWLINHDAWEGFVKFFHVEDIESSIRNVLVAFAGVAGIGASLAYMIR